MDGVASGLAWSVSPDVIRLIDALHCGAALIDREGRFVYVNPSFRLLAGRPEESLIGQPAWSLYEKDYDIRYVRRVLDHFDTPAQREFRVARPDGSAIPVIFAGKPLPEPDGGQARYRVVTAIDISEQKESAKVVAELSDRVMEQALVLRDDNAVLEAKVRQRTHQLHEANMDAITMLAIASETKDHDTGAHVRRLQRYTQAVAQQLGLSAREAEELGYSAILHDVGKIQVPDEILKKPGRLTSDERAVMEQHTTAGEAILSDKPFFATARVIARSHHENFDGSGYPDRLAGDAIPLSAMIVHTVDVFDALTSPRVYKQAWPFERAMQVIDEGSGCMFDPKVAQAVQVLADQGKLHELMAG